MSVVLKLGRYVVRGLNYSQVIHVKPDSVSGSRQSVQHWQRGKPRRPEECGVWHNGEKILDYAQMRGTANP